MIVKSVSVQGTRASPSVLAPDDAPVAKPKVGAASIDRPDRGIQGWPSALLDTKIPSRGDIRKQHHLDLPITATRASHSCRPQVAVVARNHQRSFRHDCRQLIAFDIEQGDRRPPTNAIRDPPPSMAEKLRYHRASANAGRPSKGSAFPIAKTELSVG